METLTLQLEIPGESVTPINMAAALINTYQLNLDELDELATYLKIYVKKREKEYEKNCSAGSRW